jgi:hypothetical protein
MLTPDQLTRLELIEQFLDGTTHIEFRAPAAAARRACIDPAARFARAAR